MSTTTTTWHKSLFTHWWWCWLLFFHTIIVNMTVTTGFVLRESNDILSSTSTLSLSPTKSSPSSSLLNPLTNTLTTTSTSLLDSVNGQMDETSKMTKNDDTNIINDDDDDLLKKARQLREEAQQMEEQLRASSSSSSTSATNTANADNNKPKLVKVTKLEDSVWTFSYRFSSQPKDDNDENNKKDGLAKGNDTNSAKSIIVPNYSGKVTIKLTNDGYSELVPMSSNDESSKIQIKKVWGWDEEYSREDGQQYLLFSMDVQFPETDPKLPNIMERYYFQARIERDGRDDDDDENSIITLKEGTITVKKDVSEKTGGMWGLFNVAGILSQFRYVGDFIAKPSQE